MNRVRTLHALAVIWTMSAHVGCDRKQSEQAPAKAQDNTMPRTDLDGLGRLINLPYTPSSTKWATEKYPQGGNWSLTVLLSLAREDVRSLLASAEVLPNCRPKVTREVFREWLPPAVQTENKSSQASDGETVSVDAVCIRPTPFTMPEKSPAIHGEALVFEKHGLVLLDLYTM